MDNDHTWQQKNGHLYWQVVVVQRFFLLYEFKIEPLNGGRYL